MNNIKQVIKVSGYRKNYIAEKIGVPPSHISMWISEDRKASPERVRKLCKILGCKTVDLYPGEK
jgi:transcriptional regulator with XRE-family HTH domain